VSNYKGVYEDKFVQNLRRYSSIRKNIKRRVGRVLSDPYQNTETLTDASKKLDLRGCRSARVDRNFRIIFVICEECRNIPECEYCFCNGLEDKTVVFLTFGPHDKAYAIK
jgi:mRNA-degrading endonuclease RelE of RelBE toxin-antitoxin system